MPFRSFDDLESMFQEVVEDFSNNWSCSEILYFNGFGPNESQ